MKTNTVGFSIVTMALFMMFASLAEADPSHQALLGKMLVLAGRLAREQGLEDGFRSIINTGRVGRQEVYHLHVHILGGPHPLGSMIRK